MFNIILNKDKPIILIDYSYYIFYRYFATFRWYSFKKIELIVETITENDEFMNSFIKHFNNDMKKIQKKWKTDINNIVLCMDCPRSKIWRNDIYPVYKATRVQNENFNPSIFKKFNEYINKINIKKIFYERLEGDDIIYLTQKKLLEFTNTNINIVIITNDNDYLQLAKDNVQIFNMQMKDITLRGTKDPKLDLLIKALYGDKSDNILKLASYISKEKAYEIANMSYIDRQKWLIDNNLLDKFILNMSLISFEQIPNTITDNFYKYISISIN